LAVITIKEPEQNMLFNQILRKLM